MKVQFNIYTNFYNRFNCKNNKSLKIISNIVRTSFSEFLAFFKIISLFPYALTNLNTKNVKKNPKNVPIIFVHGLLHNKSGWVPLIEKIKATKGMKDNPVRAINLSSTFQSIEKSAEEVKKEIKKVQKETGCKKVILVGHSMGGVVSSFAAQNSDLVAGVATLSSPMDGTSTSPLVPFVKSVREMAHKSLFAKNLKKSIQNTPKAKYLFIGNYGDIIIVPNKSTVGNHELNQESYIVPRTGHLGVFFHKDVHSKVIEHIKKVTAEIQATI